VIKPCLIVYPSRHQVLQRCQA